MKYEIKYNMSLENTWQKDRLLPDQLYEIK